jgi:hypothetical protein
MLVTITQAKVDRMLTHNNDFDTNNSPSKEFINSKITDLTFSTQDLSGYRFSNCDFLRADFSNCNLLDVVFSNCNFIDCDFTLSTIVHSSFSGCRLDDCLFLYTACRSLTFSKSFLTFCTFSGSSWSDVKFQSCMHHRLGLQEVILQKYEGLTLKLVLDSKGFPIIFDEKDNCIYHKTIAGRPTEVLDHLHYADPKFLNPEYRKELKGLITSLVA